MNLLICLIVLFSFSVTSGLPSAKRRHIRAMGGDSAALGQFPFVVSIGLKGSLCMSKCGGSIIGEKTVVTAAQCVFGYSVDLLTVLAGTSLLDTGGIFYNVSRITVHPDYTKYTYYFNDIAIITIDGTFEFNDLVNKISISYISSDEDYQLLTLIGWGDNYPYGYRNDLQFTKVLHITDEDCDKMLQSGGVVYPRGPGQFCASSFNGVGPCRSDLGGPLIDKNGYLVGIVSYNTLSCANGLPYVYTAVEHYESWIITTMTAAQPHNRQFKLRKGKRLGIKI